MAAQHGPIGSKRAPKRDALAVARRVAIGALVVAIVVVGVFAVMHKGKTQSHSGPPSQNISAPPKKLSLGEKVLALQSLTKVASESHVPAKATFKLIYDTYKVPGSPSQVIVEQMPLDRLFDARTSEVIVKGNHTYYCKTTQVVSCEIKTSAAATPLGRLVAEFNSGSYASTFNTLRKFVRVGAFYYFSSYNETFAAQPSDCVSWRYAYSYSVVNFCVTKSGILTYFAISGLSSSGNASILTFSIKLISYSTNLSPADFVLPQRTKVTTTKAA